MFESVANKTDTNHIVYYETEHIRVPVLELTRAQGRWQVHHTRSTSLLKTDAMDKLRAWAKDRIAVLETTRKMMQ